MRQFSFFLPTIDNKTDHGWSGGITKTTTSTQLGSVRLPHRRERYNSYYVNRLKFAEKVRYELFELQNYIFILHTCIMAEMSTVVSVSLHGLRAQMKKKIK